MHVTLYPRINVFYHEGRCKPRLYIHLLYFRVMIKEETQVPYSGVAPRTAKLALFLIKFMKFEILQFLLHEYLEENLYCVYMPNNYRL